MLFRQLFHCDSSTYSYLVGSAGAAVLVDPVLEEVPKYLQLFAELGLSLKFALDTHVHADHVTGLGALREKTGCVTVMGKQAGAVCVSRAVTDGDVVEFGDTAITAIYTPGHTDDSYCYALADRVFTGDTLLIRGTGRTDFQNGDARTQYASITTKLLSLPDETFVYPAHDYKGWMVSTIGEERRHNPRLQVSGPDEYAQIMDNLNLADPKLMDIAVSANKRCGAPDQ